MVATTRSKSYAFALDGPLKHHRKHTAKYAAKLQAKTEAEAEKRFRGEQAEYERLLKQYAEESKTSKGGRHRTRRGRKSRSTRRR